MEVWDEEKEVRTESLDELEAFLLSELEKDKVFSINLGLTQNQKISEMTLIQGHASSFVWKPFDMSGIRPEVMTHKLNVFRDTKSVK